MNGKIRYGKSIIQYSIVKSKRRKTSEIQVNEKKVELRVPISKTNMQIKNIMEGKKKWIYKKQLEFKSKKNMQKQEIYKSFLPYFGKKCLLKIVLDQKKNSVKFENSKFTITLTNKRPLKKEIQKVYEEWLNTKACQYFGG